MFEFAEEFYADSLCNPGNTLSPCLVITGQPGIGNLYGTGTRCECAVRKENRSSRSCWLFVDEGVFKQPADFEPGYYKIVIWTLVDSDAVSGPPIKLVSHGTQHFVLYTTSPTPSRWDKIHQSMDRAVCVMNPWTMAEIRRAAPFVPQTCPYKPSKQYFTSLALPRVYVLERSNRWSIIEGVWMRH